MLDIDGAHGQQGSALPSGVVSPVVTSAICRQTEGRVLFTCTDAGGLAGATLVYDYAAGGWTIDSVYDADTAVQGAPATHAIAIDGVYYRGSRGTGRVWKEQFASCFDGAKWVTSLIETAWVKPSGLHGESDVTRVIVAGQQESNATVLVGVEYDYRDDAWEDTLEYAADEVANINRKMGRVHLEKRPNNNGRCMSLKVRVQDAAPVDLGAWPATTGKGISWFGLTVEAAARAGGVRLLEGAG